jgi:hypothetical protein
MANRATAVVVCLISALATSACNDGDEGATTVPGDGSATEIVTTTGPAPTTEPAPTTDDVTTTEPPPITTSTSTTTTVPVRADVLALELVGCERFGIGTLVDPVMARGYLPDGQEPLIVQDRAPFTLQAMSCGDLVTDGLSHGPGHFSTAWMAIVGSDEPLTLPPESDLVAVATDSYYPPLFHTDNEGFQAATAAFGIPMTLAESMTFDPTEAGIQTGAVVDNQFVPPLSYQWSVDNINRTEVSVETGRHNLLGLDDEGAPLIYYGEFLHEPGWQGNVGTLQLGPGSAFEDLLGSEVTGPVNGDDITVTMTVFRDRD